MSKKEKKEYSYGLDLLRVISTAAVLIYHIRPELLPGGYLAVCAFLVLHGYLFAYTNGSREEFSIPAHFGKRFLRLYVPMFLVTVLSIFVLRFTPDVIWLTEKPETLSVLFGRNNWWQIAANADYFTRVTESPFTHFWYISMLLQAEIVLPFLFKLCTAVWDTLGFWFMEVPFLLLSVAAAVLPLWMRGNGAAEMRVYFGTDARAFCILFGMALGFAHCEDYRLSLPFMKKKGRSEAVFFALLAVLCALFYLGSTDTSWYSYGFLIVSLLTLLLIAVCTDQEYPVYRTLKSAFLKRFASISYEVYLLHYPMMFFRDALGWNGFLQRLAFIPAVLLAAALLHFALDLRWKKDWKVLLLTALKLVVLVGILYLAFFGTQDLIREQDHTQEMQELEAQMAENEQLVSTMQEEFLARRKEEMEAIADSTALEEMTDASELPVTGIGDSVMLGAVRALYETFPRGDFDAAQNRSHFPLIKIVEERTADGTLGNPVVIGIGSNADLPADKARYVIETCGDREIYWLTITNNWQFHNNDTIRSLGEEYDNVHILDWEAYSADHGEFFYSDGIHLTEIGRTSYAQFIFDAISADLYEEQLRLEQERLKQERRGVTIGIGDGFVLTALEDLREAVPDCYLIAGDPVDPGRTVREIEMLRESGYVPQTVFLAVGNGTAIPQDKLETVFDALEDCQILLIRVPEPAGNDMNRVLDRIVGSRDNITEYDLTGLYAEHPEWFAPDRVHLNRTGAKAFAVYVAGILPQPEEVPVTEPDPDDTPVTMVGFFLDVRDPYAYYYSAVRWAAQNGIAKGYTDSNGRPTGYFGPEDPCTRGQYIMFLYHMMGSPDFDVDSAPHFSDVKPGSNYYKAVCWAASKGIASGYAGSDRFGADDTCTRGQAMTFLYRAMGSPAVSESQIPQFKDVKKRDYCYDAVLWALNTGITSGYTGTSVFGPNDPCTRASAVTFLYRASDLS